MISTVLSVPVRTLSRIHTIAMSVVSFSFVGFDMIASNLMALLACFKHCSFNVAFVLVVNVFFVPFSSR